VSDVDPLSRLEHEQAIRDFAHLVRVFHLQLLEEGYSDAEAAQLAQAYLIATAQGSRS
jgi:hypothetical protein